MPEPDLLYQQRHLLRSFRKGSAQRTRAEFISDANYSAEQEAAGQAQANARAEAEAQRTKTEADAQARRKNERASADAELNQTRQTSDRHINEVSSAEQQARAALEEAGWLFLVEDVRAVKPAIDTNRHAGQELAGAAHDATQAAKLVPGLVRALDEAQERAKSRRQNIGIAAFLIVVVVLFLSWILYWNWQDAQQVRQFQATVTAQAAVVQTTANARMAIVQATTDAEAAVASATATAMAPLVERLQEQTGMEMVYVPPGDFTMGSSRDQGIIAESPRHSVSLDAYWIDKTEVTSDQYRKCVDAGECRAIDSTGQCTYVDISKSGHPINCVDWHQASTYCEWAGKRLPTEAEWEKAARGTDERLFPWGNQEPDSTLANFGGKVSPLKVGQHPAGASPYGALDMAGNVSEWVMDWFEFGYYSRSPRHNPLGPDSGSTRVVRGGSWDSSASAIRTAVRNSLPPDRTSISSGFRCALSPH